jgi:hypothetical protein
MQPLENWIGHELRWVQPQAFKMNYELQTPQGTAAILTFKGWFNTLAVGESGEGNWLFNRPGFWQDRVTIQDERTGGNVAVFRRNIWKGGGILEVGFGRIIKVTTNFWQTRLVFQTESDIPILAYDIKGVFRTSATLTIEPHATQVPELAWLVMLGWYLVVMMRRDSAAAAA